MPSPVYVEVTEQGGEIERAAPPKVSIISAEAADLG